MLKIIGLLVLIIFLLDWGLYILSQMFGLPDWTFIPNSVFFIFGGADYKNIIGIFLGYFLYTLGNKGSKKTENKDQEKSEKKGTEVERHTYRAHMPDGAQMILDVTDTSTRIKRILWNGVNYIPQICAFILIGGFQIFLNDLIIWKNSWSSSKIYYSEKYTKPYEEDHIDILRKWIKLAKQGDTEYQFNLGVAYENGKGLEQNKRQALNWYRLAAEKGHTKAQNNLGIMYLNGKVLPEDNTLAHMWFNIAASMGGKKPRQNKELISELMTPKQISKAHKLARECVRKKYKGC